MTRTTVVNGYSKLPIGTPKSECECECGCSMVPHDPKWYKQWIDGGLHENQFINLDLGFKPRFQC